MVNSKNGIVITKKNAEIDILSSRIPNLLLKNIYLGRVICGTHI